MSRIAAHLLAWYELHGRDLPWRQTRDPYRIWLSEVILQQTRVAQGMAYYERFVERFPDVAALAAALEDEVLKLWQGLGYYSRARNLHAAAREVAERFGGRFPQSYGEVRSLPGVGEYTAAAICSAAFDAPCAVLDGNVYRVLARVFDLEEPIDSPAGRRLFAALASEQLDPRRAGRYNQAIMDFGALQCTPQRPRCGDCPLADLCEARAAGTVAERPVKRGRQHVRDRWFHYLCFVAGGQTLLHRRGPGDIWQGLYEFPLIETPGPAAFESLCGLDAFRRLAGDASWRVADVVVLPRHQLSHQRLHATLYRLEADRLPEAEELLPVAVGALGGYAVPRLLERWLETAPTG